jgi:hypothetical protein
MWGEAVPVFTHHAMEACSGHGCHTWRILNLNIRLILTDHCHSVAAKNLSPLPRILLPFNSVIRIKLSCTCCHVIKRSLKKIADVYYFIKIVLNTQRSKNFPTKPWQLYSLFMYLCHSSCVFRMHDSVTNDFSISLLDCQVTHVYLCFNTAHVPLSLWFSQVNWSVEMRVSHGP